MESRMLSSRFVRLVPVVLAGLAASCKPSAAPTKLATADGNTACDRLMPEPLSFKVLKDYIKACNLKSVDAAFAKLPEDFRKRFVLVHTSGSTQSATPDYPRTIVFDEHANLVIAVSGMPKAQRDKMRSVAAALGPIDPAARRQGAKNAFGAFGLAPWTGPKDLTTDEADRSFETLEMDPEKKRFVMREIEFPAARADEAAQGDVVFHDGVDQKLPDCFLCHTGRNKPIWETYTLWPGTYGAFDDVIRSPSPEYEAYRRFVTGFAVRAPYRDLLGLADGATANAAATRLHLGENSRAKYSFVVTSTNSTESSEVPTDAEVRPELVPQPTYGFARLNLNLQTELMLQNYTDLARTLIESEEFPVLAGAIGAVLEGCTVYLDDIERMANVALDAAKSNPAQRISIGDMLHETIDAQQSSHMEAAKEVAAWYGVDGDKIVAPARMLLGMEEDVNKFVALRYIAQGFPHARIDSWPLGIDSAAQKHWIGYPGSAMFKRRYRAELQRLGKAQMADAATKTVCDAQQARRSAEQLTDFLDGCKAVDVAAGRVVQAIDAGKDSQSLCDPTADASLIRLVDKVSIAEAYARMTKPPQVLPSSSIKSYVDFLNYYCRGGSAWTAKSRSEIRLTVSYVATVFNRAKGVIPQGPSAVGP
jgi:hypothetical protein